MTDIGAVVGAMDLDELLSHRDETNERLLDVVDAAASPWNVKVTRVDIRDIQPPAGILKAEDAKQAQILAAEGARKQPSATPRPESIWRRPEPLAGSEIRVVRVDGATLVVEKA